MGVYVKDMEMPQKCGTCDFRVNDFTCLASSGAVLKVLYKRPDWCPLVEVKEPHGRLLDEIRVLRLLASGWEANEYPSAENVYAIPAVIEAEGGD